MFPGTSPIFGISFTSRVSTFILHISYKYKLFSTPLCVIPPNIAKYAAFRYKKAVDAAYILPKIVSPTRVSIFQQ